MRLESNELTALRAGERAHRIILARIPEPGADDFFDRGSCPGEPPGNGALNGIPVTIS